MNFQELATVMVLKGYRPQCGQCNTSPQLFYTDTRRLYIRYHEFKIEEQRWSAEIRALVDGRRVDFKLVSMRYAPSLDELVNVVEAAL